MMNTVTKLSLLGVAGVKAGWHVPERCFGSSGEMPQNALVHRYFSICCSQQASPEKNPEIWDSDIYDEWFAALKEYDQLPEADRANLERPPEPTPFIWPQNTEDLSKCQTEPVFDVDSASAEPFFDVDSACRTVLNIKIDKDPKSVQELADECDAFLDETKFCTNAPSLSWTCFELNKQSGTFQRFTQSFRIDRFCRGVRLLARRQPQQDDDDGEEEGEVETDNFSNASMYHHLNTSTRTDLSDTESPPLR